MEQPWGTGGMFGHLEIEYATLPANPNECLAFGDAWLESLRTPLLVVPSS